MNEIHIDDEVIFVLVHVLPNLQIRVYIFNLLDCVRAKSSEDFALQDVRSASDGFEIDENAFKSTRIGQS